MSKHHDLTASYGESLVTCEHQFEASYYYHQVREQCMNHIHEISKAVDEFTENGTSAHIGSALLKMVKTGQTSLSCAHVSFADTSVNYRIQLFYFIYFSLCNILFYCFYSF